MAALFGGRLFDKASKLIIDLLRAGFLIRGSVVLGPLHHCDNVVFGPALLQAVDIEEREAFYPRILVTDAVLDHCKRLENNHLHKAVLTDQMGRFVVNPFVVPFHGHDELMTSLVNLKFFFPRLGHW